MMHCEIHPFQDVEDKIRTVADEHYSDACETDDYPPMDIDWDYFRVAGVQNLCFAVTLNVENEFVGYAVFVVSNDPIHSTIVEANNVVIFVKKQHRGLPTKYLMDKSRGFFKSLNVDKINYLVKNAALKRLLQDDGYTTEFELWSIKL